jgi:Stress responsive A/B Barrel Domain
MGSVKHIALIRFKALTPERKIKEIFEVISKLPHSIPGILDYCAGVYSSPEGLNQGFTHGFIMTFKDAAARDAYLPHPEHEKAKQFVLPYVESVVVFDFES